ncbi:oxysterol-binding protein-related protein 9 isoform X2 [Brevipalpus obovatus]|uniref:oxysterol-binding protein-related protein 9 isoform X2 n=1 Tax=Brevipalpus obovatus TaxID=246614 RepID=UPI003D9DCE2F
MAVLEGPLCKWTNVVNGWQYRWFVLDHDQALLSYYTSKDKMVRGDRRGCVRLKGAVIGVDIGDDCTFTITVDGKMFHFQAQTAEERSKWVTALEETILRHTHRRRPKRSELFRLPSLQDYERKISETDTYLNLVINQTKLLDRQIEAASSENDKKKLVDLKADLLTFLDSVKHAIVLLQIAKNSLNPLDGVTNEKTSTSGPDQKETGIESSSGSVGQDQSESIPTEPSRGREDSKQNKTIGNIDNLNGVPEVSYSSDEEDFYYDAPEENPEHSNKNLLVTNTDTNVENHESFKKINALDILGMDSSDIDYDQFYEDDDEEDLGGVENHGSVISHLLSQVKIGMDLTKVVLPTFILERRSLLEMYADFFAHPDLFVKIPDHETAEERFIATVRWYMSAFHAGRKTSIAKKPYNPILGEIFKCFWSIPGFKPNHYSTTENMPDGPVPWAKCHDLTFIAEQVSHHPPISAFYAENADKKIMCAAHIYTKSKFLGLSIGVHMIGQGSIYLLEHGEEYIVTFPSGYGRSILTVPWIEMGGTVTVNCPQTDYSANIEFLTKPFYGGKKHKIQGELFNPSKKVIMSLSGEWNGVMYSKRPNGPQEVFVDTKAMKTIKKNVKPIAEQEPFESRRLWKEVTAALKMQEVNTATNAKFAVEQGQRELVKQRQATNTKWTNRVFHNLGQNWFYNHPLTQRLAGKQTEAKTDE